MSLARVLYIAGIVFIIWAIISGISLSFQMADGDTSFNSGYSFKVGLFLVGLVLVYIGRKSKSEAN